jgi:hypothetical protein
MKTLKIALGSFFVGAVLSLAPIAVYAQCDSAIYVQDMSDCHYYSRYTLVGSNCGDGVCVCAYLRTRSVHREDTCDAGPVL